MGHLFARFTHWQADLSQLVYIPCSSGLMNCTTITFYYVDYKILGCIAMDFPFICFDSISNLSGWNVNIVYGYHYLSHPGTLSLSPAHWNAPVSCSAYRYPSQTADSAWQNYSAEYAVRCASASPHGVCTWQSSSHMCILAPFAQCAVPGIGRSIRNTCP